MIFNIALGGVAYISVTAPSGASISAALSGVTKTGTGTCTLEVPMTGSWTVTCTLNGVSRTATASITSFGQTAQIFFGSIIVTAPSGAVITASQSGQSNIVGSGSCTLLTPTSGTWTVTSNYDNVTYTSTAALSASTPSKSLTFIKPHPEFTYSGSSQLIKDGSGNWRIKFTTSGTLKFSYLPQSTIDAFLVGGGGSGGIDNYAGGGGGGYTGTFRSISVATNTNYTITIGAGGARVTGEQAGKNGGSTSAFSKSVSGGYGGGYAEHATNTGGGGNGGSGGACGNVRAGGSDGGDGEFTYGRTNYPETHRGLGQGSTTREFGESGGTLYAGGGGCAWGAGGAGGGGDGAKGQYNANANGTDGAANTGGGGGNGAPGDGGWHSGAGGSGIVVIRNAR